MLLRRKSDGAIVVALPAPIQATLSDGVTVLVDTQYPFGDVVHVAVSVPAGREGGALPALLRVPGWASEARLSVDGTEPRPAPNGTLVSTACAAGRKTTLTLDLRPQVRVETGWGGRAGRLTNGSLDEGGYSMWTGGLPKGGDLHRGNYTVAQAEAWCNATAACVGFTFQVEDDPAHGADGADDEQRRTAAAPLASRPRHHHHHPDGGVTRTRNAPPPPSPPSAPGVHHVYFKPTFGPNTDRSWRSYSKAWAAADTNAAAVRRGPLLFALQLEQKTRVVRTWEPFKNTDVSITTPSAWNYALRLDPTHPGATLSFERVGGASGVPFNSSAPHMRIRARATRLEAWREALLAAKEPPASPVQLEGTAGQLVEDVVLIPYGATELRMGAMPWAAP